MAARVRLSPAAGASSSGEDARPVTGTVLAVDAGRTAAL